MPDYSSCPYCGRMAKDAFSSNHFPVYECRNCGTLYCKGSNCAGGPCPKCGKTQAKEVGKVYAR